jgi:hypothetical protein
MHRDEAAQRVADSLFAFEAALDTALAKGAECVAIATAARAELNLGIKVGAGSISQLATTLQPLATVREQVGVAHDGLSALQRRLGLRPELLGGGEKGPNDEVASTGSLRRVV